MVSRSYHAGWVDVWGRLAVVLNQGLNDKLMKSKAPEKLNRQVHQQRDAWVIVSDLQFKKFENCCRLRRTSISAFEFKMMPGSDEERATKHTITIAAKTVVATAIFERSNPA